MLHQPGGGGGGGGRTSVHFLDDDDSNDNSRHNAGLPAVYDKMAALLGDQPDLLARFEAFLPHGYALRRRLLAEIDGGTAIVTYSNGEPVEFTYDGSWKVSDIPNFEE